MDGGRRSRSQKIGGDGRRDAIVIAGEAGAGLESVDQSEHAGTFDKGNGKSADQSGERDEDAMDFGLFVFEEADEFVVLLDGFEGLDVYGLAGGAGAVNDAADTALEFAADGDDEAVAANGDEVFLRGAFGGELAERGAKGFFDWALLALLITANAVELGRGVVGEGAIGLDFAFDGFGQPPQRRRPVVGDLGERAKRRAGERSGKFG